MSENIRDKISMNHKKVNIRKDDVIDMMSLKHVTSLLNWWTLGQGLWDFVVRHQRNRILTLTLCTRPPMHTGVIFVDKKQRVGRIHSIQPHVGPSAQYSHWGQGVKYPAGTLRRHGVHRHKVITMSPAIKN